MQDTIAATESERASRCATIVAAGECYRYGRALMPIDAYFESQAIKGKPFALAASNVLTATLPRGLIQVND